MPHRGVWSVAAMLFGEMVHVRRDPVTNPRGTMARSRDGSKNVRETETAELLASAREVAVVAWSARRRRAMMVASLLQATTSVQFGRLPFICAPSLPLSADRLRSAGFRLLCKGTSARPSVSEAGRRPHHRADSAKHRGSNRLFR
jgi:hypothetical protein